MNKVDLVAICGLPRAGTTFLHDLFAYNKLGNDFFALHSHTGRGFAANPLSTCEPRYLNIHYRHNEPITHAIRFLVSYWRDQINNHDVTVIYKHPQLIFHGPIDEDFRFRVKYIFCMRKYNAWRHSFLECTKGESIAVETEDSIYRPYWGKKWDTPPGENDRAEHLYVRMEYYIKLFKEKLREEQRCDFQYEDPVGSLTNILEMLDIDANPLRLINRHWRTKDV
jgi:hypothetical protein